MSLPDYTDSLSDVFDTEMQNYFVLHIDTTQIISIMKLYDISWYDAVKWWQEQPVVKCWMLPQHSKYNTEEMNRYLDNIPVVVIHGDPDLVKTDAGYTSSAFLPYYNRGGISV